MIRHPGCHRCWNLCPCLRVLLHPTVAEPSILSCKSAAVPDFVRCRPKVAEGDRPVSPRAATWFHSTRPQSGQVSDGAFEHNGNSIKIVQFDLYMRHGHSQDKYGCLVDLLLGTAVTEQAVRNSLRNAVFSIACSVKRDFNRGVWKLAWPCSTTHRACRRPALRDAGRRWLAAPCQSAAASRSGTCIFGKDGAVRETRSAALMLTALCSEIPTDLEHGSQDEAPRAFEAVSCLESSTRLPTSRRTGWRRIPAQ